MLSPSDHIHTPVLLQEVLSFFHERPLAVFVDATLGLGGHSLALLQEHPEIQTLIGIDQDEQALELARERLQPYANKVRFVHSNFEELPSIVAPYGAVDGILMDIGVSSLQLDSPGRGFSFTRDDPLDMRMGTGRPYTAADVVRECDEEELGRIFRDYGEERWWRKAARTIVEARKRTPITTTGQLAAVISSCIPRTGRLHPATRIFQGLRIAVNAELDVLKQTLPRAVDLLAPGGRLAVISFHSLEDRIVKYSFREQTDRVRLLTKKPIEASREETLRNPRSRSAKLRVCERS